MIVLWESTGFLIQQCLRKLLSPPGMAEMASIWANQQTGLPGQKGGNFIPSRCKAIEEAVEVRLREDKCPPVPLSGSLWLFAKRVITTPGPELYCILLYIRNFFADFLYKTLRIKHELLGDLCRPSESSPRYCDIPGGNPPEYWKRIWIWDCSLTVRCLHISLSQLFSHLLRSDYFRQLRTYLPISEFRLRPHSTFFSVLGFLYVISSSLRNSLLNHF
jgi:hypothetical protein